MLFAVMITFERPQEVAVYVEALLRQTRRPDHLIVVDNAPDERNEQSLRRYAAADCSTTYVPRPDNPGPAGGFGAGLEVVLDHACDDDWVVLLDDDDPPFADDLIESLLDFGERHVTADRRLGGVGLTGPRFDLRSGRTRRVPDEELTGAIRVDLFGGNQLPCYRVAAIREVGVPDPTLFWGYEELEYGMRMRTAGYELLMSGEIAHRCRTHFGRLGPGIAQARAGRVKSAWRQYYTVRNLVFLLRSRGALLGALAVTARAVGKAVYLAVRRVPGWRSQWSLTWRAVSDGWRRRLGRTLESEHRLR